LKSTWIALAFAALAVPGFALVKSEESAATPPPLSYTFESDVFSRYIWRGLAFSNGAVLQNYLSVTSGQYTFTLWNNLGLEDKPPLRNGFNEFDLIFTNVQEFKNFSLESSVLFYYFPFKHYLDTAEFSLKLTFPVGPVNLFASHIMDFITYDGAHYWEFGVSADREFSPTTSLSANAGLGVGSSRFNQANFGVNTYTLNALFANLSVTYNMKGYYIRPHIGVTSILDSGLKNALTTQKATVFTAGVAVGTSF
jgi:hypothetical protein